MVATVVLRLRMMATRSAMSSAAGTSNNKCPAPKIRKWVQVMVFNADESESDDCLGEEDRELAYIEEKEEIEAYLKNQREEARAARRQSYMRNIALRNMAHR